MYSTNTCKRMFNNGGGYTANLVMLAPVARSTLCYMVKIISIVNVFV